MAKVQTHDVVSLNYSGPDRRRDGLLGRSRRLLIKVVRSKWLAMFAIAFAVSWSFHAVDKRATKRIAHNQRVIECTLRGVVAAQSRMPRITRVPVSPILQACEKHNGK